MYKANWFHCILFLITSTAYAQSMPEEVLQLHNQFRAEHHAPKLVWDNTLAAYAERHASQCLFKHSHGHYGENIAAGYPSLVDAVRGWYAEYKNYSYRRPGFAKNTGHFTQVVWRSSKRLGCAYVVCDNRNGTPGNFLVCEYSPAGNIVNAGYFKENVLEK